MSKLLINEQPLMVLPKLACAIGLNEAIVLQQVHYWLDRSDKVRDGQTWTYNTLDKWNQQFPFWSLSTLKRTLKSLRDQELLIATDKYNTLKIDKTLWYTIDYDKLLSLEKEDEPTVNQPLGQNELMGKNKGSEIVPPLGQNELMGDTNEKRVSFPWGHFDLTKSSKWSVERSKVNQALPETSTETTTDSKDKKKSRQRGKRVFDDSDVEMKLVNFFVGLITKNDPKFKKPNIQVWCDHIRLLIEQDKRTPEEIKSVMEWTTNEDFWKSNILSTKKLREKFSQLKIQMDQPARTGYGNKRGSGNGMKAPAWLDGEKEKQRSYEEGKKAEFESDIPDEDELAKMLAELGGSKASDKEKNAHY